MSKVHALLSFYPRHYITLRHVTLLYVTFHHVSLRTSFLVFGSIIAIMRDSVSYFAFLIFFVDVLFTLLSDGRILKASTLTNPCKLLQEWDMKTNPDGKSRLSFTKSPSFLSLTEPFDSYTTVKNRPCLGESNLLSCSRIL